MTPTQQTVLRERFGLGGDDAKTLNNIAETFDLTSTRIGQIGAKTLRILRHPTRARIIKPVEFNSFKNNPYITEEEKIKLSNIENELWSTDAIISSAEQSNIPRFDYSKLSILTELSTKFEARKQEAIAAGETRPFEYITIEELDLSVRAYNCLKRAGKDSVKDLLGMTQEEFAKVRNLGPRSVQEVIATIEGYGYVFEPETGFKKDEADENFHEPSPEENIEGKTYMEQGDNALYNIDGITAKTHEILKETGIVTLEQLTSKNISELSSMMSQSRCEKLISALKRRGYILNEQGNFVYIPKEEPEEVVPQTREEIESLSIYKMKLASRVVNKLKGRGILYLRDITEINVDELINMRGVGAGIINEIKNKMKEFGYTCINGRFVYEISDEEIAQKLSDVEPEQTIQIGEKSESVTHEPETIETVEQNIEEPQEEKRSESDILKEMKARREQLEQQLAALEEQTRQARELLAEYDKIIGDGKTHTEDETPDFKDE